LSLAVPRGAVNIASAVDDDDSIDSDLDYIEQLRMSRWKISELEIPITTAAANDELRNIRGVHMAGGALLESDGDDADDDEDDEDEEERKAELLLASVRRRTPIKTKSSSPITGSAWGNGAAADGQQSGQLPMVLPIRLETLQRQALEKDLEEEAFDAELAALASGNDDGLGNQARLAGRLRAPRSEATAGKQRSPQQATELQEEVDFWVHSPRGVTYEDITTAERFLFFG